MLSSYQPHPFQPPYPSSLHYPHTPPPRSPAIASTATASTVRPMPRARTQPQRQSSSQSSSRTRGHRSTDSSISAHSSSAYPQGRPIAPTEAIRMSEAAAARIPHSRAASQEHLSTPPGSPKPKLDLSNFPSPDLMKLLAELLTQIASSNDALRATSPLPSPSTSRSPSSRSSVHSSTPAPSDSPMHAASPSHSRTSSYPASPSSPQTPQNPIGLTTASRGSLTQSSLLSFHARNVPAISIEAYLLRILKYCPAPNEVFLSLLVYFDRMSKLAIEFTGKGFAIDSYNVHRLVIAGVTVASKFWSDVFYTNSRYAKVGGLPQTELNQLELQFLLLNDFRLTIAREEMQKYGDQLLLYSTHRQQLQHIQSISALLPPTPPNSLEARDGKDRVQELRGESSTSAAMDVDEEGEDEEDETVRLHSSSASEVSTARGTPITRDDSEEPPTGERDRDDERMSPR